MALVTRQQLENAALDLEHVAEIILGENASGDAINSSIDRLGNVKLTISELLRRFARESPIGPYVAGLTIERSTQTVTFDAGSGDALWSWAGTLPHTTTGLGPDEPGTNSNWLSVTPGNLGSAALVDTGTASDQIPLNSNLGDSATRNVGNSGSDVAPGSGSTVYAPLASPVLSGQPKAPTPPEGTNSTRLATTEFVNSAFGTNRAGEITFVAVLTADKLECDGSIVLRADYTRLWAIAEAHIAAGGTLFTVGDGSTTFGLPDLRAEFIRGWDNGRGIDTGRVLGSSQDDLTLYVDQFQTTQNAAPSPATRNIPTDGTFSLYAETGQSDTGTGNGLRMKTNGAAETRPRNVALIIAISF